MNAVGSVPLLPGSAILGDNEVRFADRRLAISDEAIVGAIQYELGLDEVTFSGWAAALATGAPVAIHLFADTEHVASTTCRTPLEVAPRSGVPITCGFQLAVPLEALRPAERVVRALGVAGTEAGYVSDGGQSIFREMPIRDQAHFATVAQTPFTRVDDTMQLVYLARWGLRHFPPGTGAFAAAICILGYRVLEHPGELRHLTSELWPAIEKWNETVLEPGDRPTVRWHISLNTVAGYVALLENDRERAATHFEGVAAAYGEISRSPISAHNVSISTFLAGWLRYKRGQRRLAAEYFRQAIVVVRTGLQVQPIETNYPVWNECARMSNLGQQAVWMLGQLDPEFGQRAMVPPERKQFTLAPILIRVPQLLKELPSDLKTP